jgi:hypothetical protein
MKQSQEPGGGLALSPRKRKKGQGRAVKVASMSAAGVLPPATAQKKSPSAPFHAPCLRANHLKSIRRQPHTNPPPASYQRAANRKLAQKNQTAKLKNFHFHLNSQPWPEPPKPKAGKQKSAQKISSIA